jgi:hypothetical protein
MRERENTNISGYDQGSADRMDAKVKYLKLEVRACLTVQ